MYVYVCVRESFGDRWSVPGKGMLGILQPSVKGVIVYVCLCMCADMHVCVCDQRKVSIDPLKTQSNTFI